MTHGVRGVVISRDLFGTRLIECSDRLVGLGFLVFGNRVERRMIYSVLYVLDVIGRI